MSIEFIAFPADLTATQIEWHFQLRTASGKQGLSIHRFLNHIGVEIVEQHQEKGPENPAFIEVVSRRQSARTGWKVLTFTASDLAIAKIAKAAAPSSYAAARATTESYLQSILNKDGSLRKRPKAASYQPLSSELVEA